MTYEKTTGGGDARGDGGARQGRRGRGARAVTSMALAAVVAFAAAAAADSDSDSGAVISEQPAFEIEAPADWQNVCFGTSVDVGDLDGDGHEDLVVGASPCFFFPEIPGRFAVYRGTAAEPFFSSTPIVAELEWPEPVSLVHDFLITVTTGDVDGDARDDLLVKAVGGVQVFRGAADLASSFAAPVHVQSGGAFLFAATLADFDGDGIDELVTIGGGAASISRATLEDPDSAFTLVRTLATSRFHTPGDVDGDGAEDFFTVFGSGSDLYLGCPAEDDSDSDTDSDDPACDGPLTAAPVWSAPRNVLGSLPDADGDDLPEVFLGDGVTFSTGRAWLHFSDEDTGTVEPDPAWIAIADPMFFNFGEPILSPGDIDGDGDDSEFLIGALGRLYAFFPDHGAGLTPALEPGWAWPRRDGGQSLFRGTGELFGGQPELSVAAPGDLDGDGVADLVVGSPPPFLSPILGRAYVFPGGPLPAANDPPPHLPEPAECGLADLGNEPDMTVDSGVVARSLYVDRQTYAADACEVMEGCVLAAGERRLLRFTASVANLGGATAFIPGPDTAPELYDFDPCHGHHHLEGFASYELLDGQGGSVLTARKQGYFMFDATPYCLDAAPAGFDLVDQRVSPGWADVYTAEFPCQFLDVTDTPDGEYTLRVAIDENDLIDESDVLPNEALIRIEIAGDEVTVIP